MHVTKDEVDVRMEIPGATLRQRYGLGDIGGEEISGSTSRFLPGWTPRPCSWAWRAISARCRTGGSSSGAS